jgi:hypothetical protein
LLLALVAVPFVDREEKGTGHWFGGEQGRRVVLLSAVVASVMTVGTMGIAIGAGAQWTRNAPSVLALIANPGSLLALLYAVWSWLVLRSTSSTRMGVFALVSCSLVGGTIITIVGIWLRGPNWEFVW